MSSQALPRSGSEPVVAGLRAAAVALVAIGLRFWELSWGLEDGLYFFDEHRWWSAFGRSFVPLSWASFSVEGLNYPTLYGYLVGFATALAHAFGLIDGPEPVYLDAIMVGRVLSASAGVATVALVGVIARRMYGPRVAIAAAALMAVAPLSVMQVHYASVDPVLVVCVALTLMAAHTLAIRGTPLLAALAGAGAGLAFATKYSGFVVAAPVAWAIFEATARDRSPKRALIRMAAALGGFGVAVFLVCPFCILKSDLVLAALERHHHISFVGGPLPNNHLVPSLGWYGRPYVYQLIASLPYSLGWPLYALSLVGLVTAMRIHDVGDRVLLALLLPCFLIVGSSRATFPRYLLPLFPCLVILAARTLGSGARWPRIRVTIVGAVWAYSLVLATSQVARVSYDQQEEVARWTAAATASVGSPDRPVRVGVPGRAIIPYFNLCPPLGRAGLRCVPLGNRDWYAAPLDAIVMPEWYEIAVHRDLPGSPVAVLLSQLTSGKTDYRQAARWRSWYLQRDFYTWLDPAFAAQLFQGEIGFTVYVRNPQHGT